MAKRTQQRSLFDAFEPPSPPEPAADQPTSQVGGEENSAPAETAEVIAPSQVATEPPDLTDKTVYVVDAHSLIHQVFHALPEMTSPRGEPVGAVFGFLRDLFFLLDEKRPDYLFCAFDLPGKTFRHELYEAYKAHRPEMDADLAPQFGLIRRVIAAMRIPALALEGFEADDILATVARLAEEQGGTCYLVTGDKDCRQLITQRVKVFNIRKNQVYDHEALRADWGIRPDQVVDFQALVGDPVDGVPGVPLIGPKCAQSLLEKFDVLEEILKHPEAAGGAKRKQNIETYGPQALLSRQLVQLDRHVPVPIDWPGGRTGQADWAALRELVSGFGFRSMTAKVDALVRQGPPAAEAASPATSAAPAKWHLVDTPAKFADFLEQLRQQTLISLDTETTHLWPRWAELVGLSFCWSDDEAWYLPVRAPADAARLDQETTLAALRPILEDPQVKKIGQNLKYDMIVLRAAGIHLAGLEFDTMVASYLLDAGQRNHNLDELAQRYLHHTTIKISELIGTGRQQKRMDEVPTAQIADYAAEDAWVPFRLRPILAPRLAAAGLERLFHDVEIPLVEVLADLEFLGVRIDVDKLAALSVRYGQRLEQLEGEIYELAGHPLNLASPKQLQVVLFSELKLPVLKKTKTGPSTDADVLEELAPLHALPRKLVEHRQFAKLKGTYVDALPQMVFPGTGRVHTSFNQDVAATGRLSSSNPNLQNIPVRNEQGREIRAAFIPTAGDWLFLAADYSQIELRMLAHYSGDARLREAFAKNEDIHAQVAAHIYGVALDHVTADMRRQAKAVNFGILYGQSPFGLAKQLGIEQSEAARFIDAYFGGYPGVEKFLTEILADCRRSGYVSTILGRRRAIDGVREAGGRQKNLAERTAINTVIQGSAADLIKLAMIAIQRRLRHTKSPARMVLQIHDELIFEVPAPYLDVLAELVREEMVGALALTVPLQVDLKSGPSWADTRPWQPASAGSQPSPS